MHASLEVNHRNMVSSVVKVLPICLAAMGELAVGFSCLEIKMLAAEVSSYFSISWPMGRQENSVYSLASVFRTLTTKAYSGVNVSIISLPLCPSIPYFIASYPFVIRES